jgi:DNA-binding GntR family transcriptional regulator
MRREPRDLRPDYVRIADDLREKITTGEIGLGDALPSQPAIRDTYDTSVATAQKALAVLRDEGYVAAMRGKGTYVIATQPATAEDPVMRTLRDVQARMDAMAAEITKLQKKVDALS